MDTDDTNTSMNDQNSPNQVQNQHQQQQEQKKKCRGNRRDQRFRRKCRAQHMEPGKIEKLIKKRHRIEKKDQNKNPIKQTANMNTEATSAGLNKRKRDVSLQQLSTVTKTMAQSGSQQSTEQSSMKRMKITPKTMFYSMINGNNTVHMDINYQYVVLIFSRIIIHDFVRFLDDLCI